MSQCRPGVGSDDFAKWPETNARSERRWPFTPTAMVPSEIQWIAGLGWPHSPRLQRFRHLFAATNESRGLTSK